MTWPEPSAVGNTGSAASCCHQRGQSLQPLGLWQPRAAMKTLVRNDHLESKNVSNWALGKGPSWHSLSNTVSPLIFIFFYQPKMKMHQMVVQFQSKV